MTTRSFRSNKILFHKIARERISKIKGWHYISLTIFNGKFNGKYKFQRRSNSLIGKPPFATFGSVYSIICGFKKRRSMFLKARVNIGAGINQKLEDIWSRTIGNNGSLEVRNLTNTVKQNQNSQVQVFHNISLCWRFPTNNSNISLKYIINKLWNHSEMWTGDCTIDTQL